MTWWGLWLKCKRRDAIDLWSLPCIIREIINHPPARPLLNVALYYE